MESAMSNDKATDVSAASGVEMYDDLSADYDRFVDWEGRLLAEIPFLVQQLQAVGARRVLDAACGTGMHAIALAKIGYEVLGTDVSQGMIDRARANVAQAGVDVHFERAGFGQLAQALEPEARLDAVLCLGNSLPHSQTAGSLQATLSDFAAWLRPGGLLLIQNRNFNAVLAAQDRWMEPQSHRGGDAEWLFVRFYDFAPNGLLTFNLVQLHRQANGTWSQRVTSTRLWPQTSGQLVEAVEGAGFEAIGCLGDLQGAPFDPTSSPNLVIRALKGEKRLLDDPK
jgi:SAM-dependent methyltransferase